MVPRSVRLGSTRWTLKKCLAFLGLIGLGLCLVYRAQAATSASGDSPPHQVYLPAVQAAPTQVPPTPSPGEDGLPPRYWDPRLDQRGAVLQAATVSPGQGYWRLVEATWLDEQESQGRHHIMVDVLDAQGNRLAGAPIRFWWNGGETTVLAQEKPGEPFAADFAMYAVAPAYGASPADANPADRVWGMGLGSVEQPHLAIQTSYRLVWQWTVVPGTPTATPTPTFTPSPTATPSPTPMASLTATPTPTPSPTLPPTSAPTATPTPTPSPPNSGGNLPPRYWDPRLDQRGAVLQPATVSPGQGYWRLVEATWLDEQESQGRHHIMVDVLDAQGNRLVGVPIRFWWDGGDTIVQSQAKPGEPFAADFAMYAVAPAYGASPADANPADRVWGMGLGSIEQPYFTIHTSYRLVWQWTIASGGSEPTPSPTATPTPSAPPGATPTPTPASDYLFSQARLVRCDPNAGVTYVQGTLRLNGQPANGYRVAFSYEPDGPIVATIQSGPHPGYEGWADGYYSHILMAGGPREGDWWFWVVDDQNRRISALGYVHTHAWVGSGSCQQATIDFEG